MATAAQPATGGLGEIWARIIRNMGGTATSYGEGELLNAFANALLNFNPQSLNDVAGAPAGSVAQTVARQLVTSAAETSASGVLTLTAISLPLDTVVNTLNFVSGTTAAITPTHQFAGLYDNTGKQLAVSADLLTAAIAASTVIPYPISTIAQGAASSFTTTYSGLYYVGIMVVAGTQPTWAGITGLVTDETIPPIMAGSSDTGQTAPPAFPHTAGTITPTAAALYSFLT